MVNRLGNSSVAAAKFVWLCAIALVYSVQLTAQVPSITMRISGVGKDSANVMHFSVYLKNNSAGQIKYSGSQLFIEFDKSYLNGGTGSWNIVSSALADSLRPRNLTVYTASTPGQLRAAAAVPPRVPGGANNAPVINAGDSLLIGNFKFRTSAVSFGSGEASLSWRTAPSGNPVTKIGAYIGTTNTEIQSGATYYISSFTSSLALKFFIEGLFNAESGSTTQDTVSVSLRKTHNNYDEVDRVVFVPTTEGMADITFPNAVQDTAYYLVIASRNAIETWSAMPQVFTGSKLSYDFSNSQEKAYGGNMTQKGASWCFFSGDVNQDGAIEASDLLLVDTDNLNFTTGYTVTDINADGQVEATDLLITDTNNLNFITKLTPVANKRYAKPVKAKIPVTDSK